MNYWVERAGHNNLIRVAGSEYGKTLMKFTALINSVATDSNNTSKQCGCLGSLTPSSPGISVAEEK